MSSLAIGKLQSRIGGALLFVQVSFYVALVSEDCRFTKIMHFLLHLNESININKDEHS